MLVIYLVALFILIFTGFVSWGTVAFIILGSLLYKAYTEKNNNEVNKKTENITQNKKDDSAAPSTDEILSKAHDFSFRINLHVKWDKIIKDYLGNNQDILKQLNINHLNVILEKNIASGKTTQRIFGIKYNKETNQREILESHLGEPLIYPIFNNENIENHKISHVCLHSDTRIQLYLNNSNTSTILEDTIMLFDFKLRKVLEEFIKIEKIYLNASHEEPLNLSQIDLGDGVKYLEEENPNENNQHCFFNDYVTLHIKCESNKGICNTQEEYSKSDFHSFIADYRGIHLSVGYYNFIKLCRYFDEYKVTMPFFYESKALTQPLNESEKLIIKERQQYWESKSDDFKAFTSQLSSAFSALSEDDKNFALHKLNIFQAFFYSLHDLRNKKLDKSDLDLLGNLQIKNNFIKWSNQNAIYEIQFTIVNNSFDQYQSKSYNSKSFILLHNDKTIMSFQVPMTMDRYSDMPLNFIEYFYIDSQENKIIDESLVFEFFIETLKLLRLHSFIYSKKFA